MNFLFTPRPKTMNPAKPHNDDEGMPPSRKWVPPLSPLSVIQTLLPPAREKKPSPASKEDEREAEDDAPLTGVRAPEIF